MKSFLMIVSALTVAANARSSPTLGVNTVGAVDDWAGGVAGATNPCLGDLAVLNSEALAWAEANTYHSVGDWFGHFEEAQCVVTPGQPAGGQKGKSKTCEPDTCVCTWEPPCGPMPQTLVALTCATFQCTQKPCGSWDWLEVSHGESHESCAAHNMVLDTQSCDCHCDRVAKATCVDSGKRWCDKTCTCHCPDVVIPCASVNADCKCNVHPHTVSTCYEPVCAGNMWVRNVHVGCAEGETELEHPTADGCCKPCGQQTGQKGQQGGSKSHRSMYTASIDAASAQDIEESGIIGDAFGAVTDFVGDTWDYATSFLDGDAQYQSHDDFVQEGATFHSHSHVTELCDTHNSGFGHDGHGVHTDPHAVHHEGHVMGDHSHDSDDTVVMWDDLTSTPNPPAGFVLQTGNFCVKNESLRSSYHGFTSATTGQCANVCASDETCSVCKTVNGFEAYVHMAGGLPDKCVRDQYGHASTKPGVLMNVDDLVQRVADSVARGMNNVVGV